MCSGPLCGVNVPVREQGAEQAGRGGGVGATGGLPQSADTALLGLLGVSQQGPTRMVQERSPCCNLGGTNGRVAEGWVGFSRGGGKGCALWGRVQAGFQAGW